MRIIIAIILVAVFSFAQTVSESEQCPGMPRFLVGGRLEFSNPKGMQLQLDYATSETDLSSFPSLNHTIDISGIVDSIVPIISDSLLDLPDINACVEYERNGQKDCFYGIGYIDSTDLYNHHAVRHVRLRNFRIEYEKESPMSKAVDSSWIYYPEDIKLNVGDSIFIKRYSALFNNAWSEENMCSYSPGGMIIGEYTVIPQQQTKIPTPAHTKEIEKTKIYNRDASGRFNNGKNKYIIRY